MDSLAMRCTLLVIALALLLITAPAAGAASIAYIDGGEVWLSSLDGQQKVRLASPVVNGGGTIDKWLDVAASDNGRIVGARNEPGKISRFSSFKVWEPNGSSTVEGPLNAPSGWSLYVYPLGFDITPDGSHMVYGYSNSSCCPYTFEQGTYVRPVTNSPLDPIEISGEEEPTLFGNRVIARSGTTVYVQGTSAPPYGTDFTPWLDLSGTGLDVRRTDVAANGQLAAIEVEEWNGGTQTIGKIAVIATQGVDQVPSFNVDCYLPASGVAKDVSISPDATRIAWKDDQGLKVAGTPTTHDDPCVLSSPPVVISASASKGAISGGNVGPFLGPTGNGPASSGPRATVPKKLSVKALAGAKGVPVKVRVARAGKVKIAGTVAAKVMKRRGKAVLVATGSAIAKRAGTVTVRLRLTSAARKKPSRLKGARMTLRVSQRGLSATKSVRLR